MMLIATKSQVESIQVAVEVILKKRCADCDYKGAADLLQGMSMAFGAADHKTLEEWAIKRRDEMLFLYAGQINPSVCIQLNSNKI